MNKTLLDYFGEFIEDLEKQLESDQERWGDTWKTRPLRGQEDRIFARYFDYYDQFRYGGQPIPWLKITGEAFIAWVRENYPDYSEQ